MFTRAFLDHTTQDGALVGLGVVWQDDRVYQVDLLEGGGEGRWLSDLPDVLRLAPEPSMDQVAPMWMDLAERLEGGPSTVTWPRAARGGAFQERLWTALATIPHGETRTYQEVARQLGLAQGARAVAGACAANPFALLVPCHRVIGSDGTRRGFKWGLPLKERLLRLERQMAVTWTASQGAAHA